MGVPKLRQPEAAEYSALRPLDGDADAPGPARASWQSRPDAMVRVSAHEVKIGLSVAERALDRVRRGAPAVRMGNVLAIQARIVERTDHAIEKDLAELPRDLAVASRFAAAVEIHRPAASLSAQSVQSIPDDVLEAYEGSSALVALSTVKRGMVVADPTSALLSREHPLLMPLTDDRIRHFTMEQAKGLQTEDEVLYEDSAMEGGTALKRKGAGAAFMPDGAAAPAAAASSLSANPAAAPVGSASSSSCSVSSSDSASKRSKSSKSCAASSAAGQPRRRTKIPPSAVEILESWFVAHVSKPYPSEDEKQRLMENTGLDIVQLNNWYTNTRKRRWVQHPTDPSQNMLTAIRIDKGGAGDAPMKPKVKRGPRNAAAATKKGAAESDEEPKEESSASDPEVEM